MRSAFPGCFSRIPSCGRSIISARRRAIRTKASTSRCRKRCCTAGCSRRTSANLPASFADYLKFISQVLEENSKRGGIAMKFEVAYFRPTTFGDPTRAQAEEIYQRYAAGGVPPRRNIGPFRISSSASWSRKAGGCILPVHIHTAVGIGDYFNLSQATS